MLRLVAILDPPLGSDLAATRAVFAGPHGTIAVASTAPWVGWAGRALDAGQRLRHRVALYRAMGEAPVAVLDELRYPVNDVHCDPSSRWVAIGTGTYDGGYLYEGELVLWDHETGERWRPLRESREVVRCRYQNDGRLALRLRPRNDEIDEDEGIAVGPRGDITPIDLVEAGLDTLPVASALVEQVAAMSAVRSQVRDAAWLDHERVAFTSARGVVEVFTRGGRPLAVFPVDGDPVQVLGRWVHVIEKGGPSTLWELSPDGLVRRHVLPGVFAMSIDSHGRVLARETSFSARTPGRDRLLDPARVEPLLATVDLGQHDGFNHFLRVDGGPSLYFLRGTPREQHCDKRLCALDRDGSVRELLRWDPPGAHLMQGSATRVGDGGWVRSFHSYDRLPPPCVAGLEALAPDGATRWLREMPAVASAMVALPERPAVAVALLDGTVHLVDSTTGASVETLASDAEGPSTVVTALAWSAPHLAMGTFDGQRRIYELA